MESQVCELFALNYDVDPESFRRFFKSFYESSFQSERCIRLTALDGDKVVGFQSFFYWPLNYAGKQLAAYQSGNSLVHPEYRGQRIFGRLLKYGDEVLEEHNAEVLIGFPVDASLGSFIRKGWNADVKLQWHVKSLGWLNLFRKPVALAPQVDRLNVKNESEGLVSSWSPDFLAWRKTYHDQTYYEVKVEYEETELVLVLKTSLRARIIHELIVGEVYCSTRDEKLIRILWRKALKVMRRDFKGYSMLSFACNAETARPLDKVISADLYRIKKQIHFIFRKLKDATVLPQTEQWFMYRGDIDTW